MHLGWINSKLDLFVKQKKKNHSRRCHFVLALHVQDIDQAIKIET